MSTALAPVPINAGDKAQFERSTNDEALVELWATWPRKAASAGTTAWYRRTGRNFLRAIGKPLQAVTATRLPILVSCANCRPAALMKAT